MFYWIHITELSHAKSTQGRNLTGSARHIRDLIADIHKNIQIWNTLHLEGIILLKNIIQIKQDDSYSEILQEQCDKLENICDSLVMHLLIFFIFFFSYFYYKKNVFITIFFLEYYCRKSCSNHKTYKNNGIFRN